MGGGGGGSNFFMVDFESLTPSDMSKILPNGNYGQIMTQYDSFYTPSGTAVITTDYSGLVVKHNDTSWQTVIDALNVWCASNLSPGAYYSFTVSSGFDPATLLLPTQDANFINLNSNGQTEQMVFKVRLPTGNIKQMSFY